MSDAEIDSALGDKQHQIAKALYSDTTIKVEVAGECYSVHFQPCDSLASGTGYRRLTKMKGIEFNDFVDPSEEQPLRKAIALAVCEKELQILFSGGCFDADRHGCQLRVDVAGRDIYLGLYDFGEMSLEPLTDAEIHSFALLLKDFPKVIKQNENIANLFERHIRQAMENGQPYRHLMRINKALLALNDFRQALDNREIASIIQKISWQIEPRLYRALREGQLNTITLSDYPKFIWHQVSTMYASATAKLDKPFGLM